MRTRSPAVGLLVSLLSVSPLAAQGLGDVAARERAKREKETAGADAARQVFDNEDLERGRPAGSEQKDGKKRTSSSAASQSPSGEEVGAPEAGIVSPDISAPDREAEPPSPPGGSSVAELEARIKVLQDRLNPMSGSYIFGPFGSGDPTEEPRTRDELQRLEAELVKAREEAARAPVPPRREQESAQ
jgi:hypothetical protein